MNLRAITFTVVAILVLQITGCASNYWKTLPDDLYTNQKAGFQVKAPKGWFAGKGVSGPLVITKDGPLLQAIEITEMALKKSFPKTKRVVADDTEPLELADYYLAEFKSELEGITVVDKKSLSPASIEQNDAFNMVLEFNSVEGLGYRVNVYGFVRAGKMYTLKYQAPRLHYYDRYAVDFKKVVESFSLKS